MKSCWLMGAGRVIAVDYVDYRLEFAKKYANVETLNFKDVDVVTAIKGMTEGRGANATIDAVGCEAAGSKLHRTLGIGLKMEGGSPAALNMCLHSTRKGGHVSIVGAYGPPFALVDIGTAMNKGLTLRMNQCNVHRYMPHLLEHIRAGRIDAKGIITHRISLEDTPHGYHIFANKLDGCVKCVIDPHAKA
jgi:threonine dehydrogenase-like Zn-dependent dehydrogenase